MKNTLPSNTGIVASIISTAIFTELFTERNIETPHSFRYPTRGSRPGATLKNCTRWRQALDRLPPLILSLYVCVVFPPLYAWE
jgi:hypothetical protein